MPVLADPGDDDIPKETVARLLAQWSVACGAIAPPPLVLLPSLVKERWNTQRAALAHLRASLNPPILHRKEMFVGEGYPRRATFARFTAQEERAGLFAEPTTTGTREQRRRTLMACEVQTRGHRLVRAKATVRQAGGEVNVEAAKN